MISHKKTQTNKSKKMTTKRISKPVKKRKSKQVGNTLRPNKTKNISKTCNDDEADLAFLKRMTGASCIDTGNLFIRQVISCLPEELHAEGNVIDVAMSMLLDIKPKDELEGMLAAQMIAVQVTSMNMSSRIMTKGQSREGIASYVNNMTKLMRTFTTQLEALQKYRGKCNQTIQVQHVQVNDGGQAVVGNVQGGGDNG